MLILSCLAGALAVWLWMPGSSTRSLHRRLTPGGSATGSRLHNGRNASGRQAVRTSGARSPRRPVLPIACGVLGGAFAAGVGLDGSRGGVLAAAALITVGTAVLLWRGRRLMRSTAAFRAEVSAACAALAGHLRAGQVPSEAVVLTARDCPVFAEARRAQELGGDPTRVWRQQSQRLGGGGLAQLARAWEVSLHTGAPLAATLDQVTAALREDADVRWMVDGELAVSRATGAVMAGLPVGGIGLGYLLGGDPLAWLIDSPAGWTCLILGLLLGCGGVWWIELLARGVWR